MPTENQKCQMNRIGYFQFFGTGPNEGVAVFATSETSSANQAGVFFSVGKDEFKPL